MEHDSRDKLSTWKTIWQVRFPSAAMLLDNRGNIAARWQHRLEDLTEWTIGTNQLSIHDKANTMLLRVELRAVTVVVESTERQSQFGDLATEFTFDMLDILKVRKIERVGLRLLRCSERSNFKAISNLIRRRFFNLSDDEWQLFGQHPDDIGMPLVFRYDDSTLNWHFGPMEKAQLETYFESAEVKKSLPDASIFFDCDLYQVDPKIHAKEFKKELGRFVSSETKRICDLTDAFLSRFGGFR